MDLSCEWDPHKAAANRRKHGVSFEEAVEAVARAPAAGEAGARRRAAREKRRVRTSIPGYQDVVGGDPRSGVQAGLSELDAL
jgi:uncharacterized DUF497 family protein